MPDQKIITVNQRPVIRQSSIHSKRPGVWGASGPKYPDVMASMFRLARMSMADLSSQHILELSGSRVLSDAKVRMNGLNIHDFGGVGHVHLNKDLHVDHPGLIGPKIFVRKVVAQLKKSHPKTVAQRVGPLSTHSSLLGATINPTWSQTESVIIADTLNLENRTITIDRRTISHLWIIARRIEAGAGARITYTPLTNPGVGNAGVNGHPNPGQLNYNRYARQSTSGHYAHNGGNGHHGQDGHTGPAGLNAPDVTICVLEIDSMPDIILPGQKGGRGGTGGRGANGGNGQRGRDSKVRKRWGTPYDCAHGPGYGGNGGRGGDGGCGGRGGNGGDGANITIATLQENITPLVTERPFTLDISGGNGGENGHQGAPGQGGFGGQYGHRTGWPCSHERDRWGQNGERGQYTGDLGPGLEGDPGTLSYEILTREEWELKLESPCITSLSASSGFAGDRITIHGMHFTDRAKVEIGGKSIAASFENSEKLTFIIPQNMPGGEHGVKVRTPDGDTSNEVPYFVRPMLTEIHKAGQVTDTVLAGDTITLTGRSFVSGAGVMDDGQTLTTDALSQYSITLNIPEIIGEDAGGVMSLVVQNPDGHRSNELTVQRLPSLDSGFRAAVNGYAFKNFKKGKGTWGDFLNTFDSDEVAGELILHPVLTGAYYLFFHKMLSGEGAKCTAFATTSLKKYHQSVTDLYAQGPVSDDDPPPISRSLMHELDIAQGRTLGKELIVHYANQGREGIDRVETSIREIEQDFLDGLGENSSRVLCMIPSGEVWEVFSDKEYRKAFLDSHCILPTRITYPDMSRSLDGAKLYVYDSNEPGKDTQCMDLFEKDGKIHFNYTGGNNNFSSETGFTLGTQTLLKQLFQDVDLPFSGGSATGAVLAFVAEMVMSPANITVEDQAGHSLGFKDGLIQSDPALGYVCPWMEKLMLLRDDAGDVTRTITGEGSGSYTYASIHPAGKSVLIKDAACTAQTVDKVFINPDYTEIGVETHEDKSMDIHVGHKLEDDTVRYVNLRFGLEASEQATISFNPDLDGAVVTMPNRKISADISVVMFDGAALRKSRSMKVTIPPNKNLSLPAGMWNQFGTFKAETT